MWHKFSSADYLEVARSSHELAAIAFSCLCCIFSFSNIYSSHVSAGTLKWIGILINDGQTVAHAQNARNHENGIFATIRQKNLIVSGARLIITRENPRFSGQVNVILFDWNMHFIKRVHCYGKKTHKFHQINAPNVLLTWSVFDPIDWTRRVLPIQVSFGNYVCPKTIIITCVIHKMTVWESHGMYNQIKPKLVSYELVWKDSLLYLDRRKSGTEQKYEWVSELNDTVMFI